MQSNSLCNHSNQGFSYLEYFDKYKFDYPTMQVICLACGTGLAPIAAAIESDSLGLKKKTYNALYEREGILYVGARSYERLPLKERYADWEARGIKVVPVLSQPGEGWTGRKGYVQHALKEDGVKIPRNSGVLLCGHRFV